MKAPEGTFKASLFPHKGGGPVEPIIRATLEDLPRILERVEAEDLSLTIFFTHGATLYADCGQDGWFFANEITDRGWGNVHTTVPEPGTISVVAGGQRITVPKAKCIRGSELYLAVEARLRG